MTKTDRRMVIFWMIAGPLLVAWWFFLQWMNSPQRIVAPIAYLTNIIPLHSTVGDAARIADALLSRRGTRTYLILVQDMQTARPTGGDIASVVLVVMHDGVVTSVTSHDPRDLADAPIDRDQYDAITMGLPAAVNPFSMRDSNWFTDFPTSARIAAHIYRVQFPQISIDAVLSVDAVALDVVLDAIAPLTVGECVVRNGNDVVHQQCRRTGGMMDSAKAHFVGDALSAMFTSISHTASVWQRMALLKAFVQLCDTKHIHITPLRNMNLSAPLQRRGWDGSVDAVWKKDYIMVDDGAVSPYGVESRVSRSVTYAIDLSQSIPQAVVTVRYAYGSTAPHKMSVADYLTFVRVTVPRNTWFTSVVPCESAPHYGMKYGRRYAACTVRIPYGSTTDVVFHYNLPIDVRNHYPYDVKIQHHAGVGAVPWTIRIRKAGSDGLQTYSAVVDRDMTLRRDIVDTSPF